MATRATGTSWADVIITLIEFAREDPWHFALVVIFPLTLFSIGFSRLLRFVGQKPIGRLVDAFATHLEQKTPAKPLTHDPRQDKGGPK